MWEKRDYVSDRWGELKKGRERTRWVRTPLGAKPASFKIIFIILACSRLFGNSKTRQLKNILKVTGNEERKFIIP